MKPYFAVQWHITDFCDQRCKHCYIYSEGHDRIISTSRADLERTLGQIRSFCDAIGREPYIYLTGGDPILHPDFWHLLSLFKSREIRFCVMGNPFHLTGDVCERMRDAGCVKYQLSLDGLERTHDSFRKPGSFRATMEAAEAVKKSGMWLALMSTVSRANMDEIPSVIDLADQIGADVHAVGRYCPTSAEKSLDPGLHITPTEYRAFLERCWERYEAHRGSKTTFQLKDHLWTLFLHEKGLMEIPEGGEITDGCNCARNHITILPDGEVLACRRMESRVGNLAARSLQEIWTGAQMEAYRQYERFEKCAGCELRSVCRGCPAVSSGYSGGNFYAPDPQCWK